MGAHEQLQYQNEFQQVLITLATRFINVPVDQLDATITEALKEIGIFVGGFRTTINQINPDWSSFVQIYRWTQPGYPPSKSTYALLPDADQLIPILERRESFTVTDRETLSKDSEMPGFLLNLGIRAVIVVPIFRQGNLFGFVATSWDEPHIIAAETVVLLRVAAEIFVNAMDRRDNEGHLQKLNNELEARVEERTKELRTVNEQLQNEIEERRQVEKALRESEKRYRIVNEVISDYAFLYAVLPDGSLKLEWGTADSFTRLSGYTLADMETGTFGSYVPGDEQKARDDVAQTLQGYPTEREYQVITRSGEKRWLLMRRIPIWDVAHTRVEHFYGVAQDITRRKEAEEALRQSEATLRATFEQAAVGIAHVSPDVRLIRVNQRLCDMLGYTLEELIGRTIYDITYPGDLSGDRLNPLEQALAGEIQSYSLHKRYVHKTGRLIWVKVTASLVHDEAGKPDYFVSVIEDISAVYTAELALRESEERYRIVTELISDYAFLCAVTPDGGFELEWITADSYKRLTGFDANDQPFTTYHPDDAALAREDVQRTIQGEITEREYRIMTKQGEPRWISLRRYPVWDSAHEHVVRFYGVAQDITMRKKLEAEEREQRALAEALVDTAAALNSTLDLDEVLDRILTNLERVVPNISGSIFLVESGMAHLVRANSASPAGWKEKAETLILPLESTPNLLQVYQTGQPCIIPDVREYADWIDVPANRWIRCHVTVPIKRGEEVVGFLTWISPIPDSFDPRIMPRLEAFAYQTGIAITNAKLYQQGKSLAIFEERQRLARDLHDAVTQTLFSANMIAEMLPREMDDNPEQARQGLIQLHYLTRGALAEMRSLLLELRPEALESESLTRLITQLIAAFSGRTGIVPVVTITGERTLPQEVKIALYRIAQEALNNISKHARATQVCVNLSLNAVVELTVCDNGRGFNPAQAKPGSLGLKIMHERAEAIGAQLTITSIPSEQTTFKVQWMG